MLLLSASSLFFLFLFFFGCIVGSFLNVVADRLPEGKSFLWGRSKCEYCKRDLHGKDLIPVISFLLLQGKCRYCHHKLSYYYPAAELLTGFVFILVGMVLVSSGGVVFFSDVRYFFLFIYYLFIASSLLVVFFTDLKYGIIPFKVVFFSFVIALLWYAYLFFLYVTRSQLPLFHFTNALFILNYLFSGLSVFFFFLLLFIGTKGRGLGFGDVIYVALMGFLLGFPSIIIGIYISFLTGAIVSLILVLLGRKRFSGGTIPFGPFLVFGTLVSLFWGQWLVQMAVKLLFHM